ncbi:hypothetical protein BPY_00450 [Bifidobacterium psychraerophilum]|uniref:hypothetical protein n=1 Tax=Bifidobacterium psychraerophilum TaxID=218140 RepID=UPI00311063B4
MKNKIIGVLLSTVAVLSMGACGNTTASQSSSADTTTSEAPKPLDLTGTWVEKNPKSTDMVQEATISGDVITINWKQSDGTSALYWSGTYQAPTSAATTYEWTSKADTEKLSSAILASQDATKKFSYNNGKLTYEVTAMGVTATAELEKQ